VVTKKDKHLAAAQKFMERGSFEKALAEFQNAVKEDPKDTRTWLRMAEVQVRLGRTDKATEVYQKTVDLYVEQGFFQRAVAVYKNIIKLSPEIVDARVKLADVYRQLGLLSDASQQLEHATTLLQKSNRITESLSVIRQMIDLNPDQPAARIRFAELAAQTGATKDASAEFREAARLLKNQSRSDEWLRVSERYLHYQPEDGEIAKEVAAHYLEITNPKAALARLKPVFEKEPRNPEILELLARTFEQLGQSTKSLPVLKELFRVYSDTGRTSERNQTAQRILLLEPSNHELAEMVGASSNSAQRGMSSIGGMRLVTPPTMAHPASGDPISPLAAGSAGKRPLAITFGELEIVHPKTPQTPSLPDPVPTSISEKIEIANGLMEKPEDDAEVMRILAEADVFVKYGLVERAADHLQRVFERVPSHLGAHERLAAVLVQLGRNVEAAREYETLAQQVLSTNPSSAVGFARKALELNPSARRADEVLRMLSGASPTILPMSSVIPSVAREEADSLDYQMATPEPELIESDEIELIASDLEESETLSPDEIAAESDQLVTRDDIPVPFEVGVLDEPLDPKFAKQSSESEIRSELAQVDFFIEQGLIDDAAGMLNAVEEHNPGHPWITERRQTIEALISAAELSQGAMPTIARGEVNAQGRDVPANSSFPVTRPMGESDHDLDTRADLGIMEKTMERYESAIQHFTALLTDSKREVFALTMIGECYEARGDFGDAIRYYQDALKRPVATETEATQIYYQLGNVFQTLGDRSEALYYFERVSKRDPSFRDVQRRLQELKARVGTHS
jgi:tetratricopeptide (TPR) repeat protein